MGGFHPLDIIVVVGIALLLFGPKALQSLSHNAGKGVGQAKGVKEKMLAELPMEDFTKVTETISKIPLSPQQAAKKLVVSSIMPNEKKTEDEAAAEPTQEQQ